MSKPKDSRNRGFEEKAHLNVDQDAYGDGWDRIFGGVKITCVNKEEAEIDKEIERIHQMAIKDKARHSFRNLDTDNGSEGFPDGPSYIYGYMQGYNQALKDNK